MSAILGNIVAGIRAAAGGAKPATGGNAQNKPADARKTLRIACIGHAGSGKTTFWTVLEAATRGRADGFRVQSADNATQAYLTRQRETMEAATPVDPTATGSVRQVEPSAYMPGFPNPTDLSAELLFRAGEPGRGDRLVRILDYPGGSVAVEDAEGYSQTVIETIKEADAVLFFMDAVVTRSDRDVREQQLAAFRSLLIHIEDSHGRIHVPVGFVLTKSDCFPGFRAANPARLPSPEGWRRGQPFLAFLKAVMKAAVFGADPAWGERVQKTLGRLQSFVGVLLEECSSQQFFFVSAVGERGSTPGEFAADLEESQYLGAAKKKYKLGARQAGLEAPLRWALHEVTIGAEQAQAAALRKRALALAAGWALIVSLPFLGYLGCCTPKLEADLKHNPIVAIDVLQHGKELQTNYFVALWSRFDSQGFLQRANVVRDSVRARTLETGLETLPEILEKSRRGVAAPVVVAELRTWGAALRRCAQALTVTRAPMQGDVAVGGDEETGKVRSLAALYDTLAAGYSFDPRSQQDLIDKIPQSYAKCMTPAIKSALIDIHDREFRVFLSDTIRLDDRGYATLKAICRGGQRPYGNYRWSRSGQPIDSATDSLYVARAAGDYAVSVRDAEANSASSACKVLPALPVAPIGGGGAAGPAATFAATYNDFVAKNQEALRRPETRLTLEVVKGVQELERMLRSQPVDDEASKAAAHYVTRFLRAVSDYWQGKDIRIRVTLLDAPGRMQLPGSAPFSQGDEVTIPHWSYDRKVDMTCFGGAAQGVPFHIDNLVAQAGQHLEVKDMPAAKRQGNVNFEYEIVHPAVNEVSVPDLPKAN